MKPAVIVYTAIFGNYDTLRQQPNNPRAIYRCYGDHPQPSKQWKFISRERKQASIQLDARYHKIMCHYMDDCDCSIWIDANNRLWDDPVSICKKWLADADIAVFRHPYRDCIYVEEQACEHFKKDSPEVMRQHVARYRAEGYPAHNGLASTGFIARRHTPQVKKFNEFWWNEVLSGSYRDQLSFPYVAWKTGMKIQWVLGHAEIMADVKRPHKPYKG